MVWFTFVLLFVAGYGVGQAREIRNRHGHYLRGYQEAKNRFHPDAHQEPQVVSNLLRRSTDF